PVAAARVSAFDAAPGGVAPLDQANTAQDGRYMLQVPPSTPLLVTATPMGEMRMSGKRVTGKRGAVPDDGSLRQDLLPAYVAATARIGAESKLDDLVLGEPSLVSGRVAFTDGAPVAKAELFLGPQGTRSLGVGERIGLRMRDDNKLAPATGIHTD